MSKQLISVLAIVVTILLIVILWPEQKTSEEASSGSSMALNEQTAESSDASPAEVGVSNSEPPSWSYSKEDFDKKEAFWEKAHKSPINFWGKVVDEDSAPIAGANIEIIVYNDPEWSESGGSNSRYIKTSDENGLFSLTGKNGVRLSATATHPSFSKQIDHSSRKNLSRVVINYAGVESPTAQARPTQLNPSILVLGRKLEPANIVHAVVKKTPLQPDGKAERVNIKIGTNNIQLDVSCWSSSPTPFSYDKYDWRAKIQVVGGDIQPVIDPLQIKAPTTGYEPHQIVQMKKDMDHGWLRNSPNEMTTFWIRLADNTYAKSKIVIRTGRRHEVDVEVWHNADGANNFQR